MKYANSEILKNEHSAISNSFFLISFKVNSDGDLRFLYDFYLRKVNIIGPPYMLATQDRDLSRKLRKAAIIMPKRISFLCIPGSQIYMKMENHCNITL